jgi:transposase-like protein
MLGLQIQWTSRMPDARESRLSIVEPAEEISALSAEETPPSAAKRDGSRRRRLNHDEEREIARLYGRTGTPTSEIRARFGIGDSSLYRVVQRLGVALRGRTASSTQPNASRTQAPARARPRRSSNAGGESVSPPRSRAATTEIPASPRVDRRSSRGAAWPASATQATTPAKRAASQSGGSAGQRFQIRFEGESVFDATDILDALRQAQSLGAVEILAVSRED